MIRISFRTFYYSVDWQAARPLSLFAPNCQKKDVFDDTPSVVAQGEETGHHGGAVKTLTSLDVNDYKTAFKNKKMSEIVRALFIFKLCTYDVLVKNSLTLMKISKRLLGPRLYNRCMKTTIYSQFVAGETEDELKVAIGKLQQSGMGPLLSVPIEEDAGQPVSRDVWYNQNLEVILRCIRLSKQMDPNYPMSMIKLTAIVPGNLCLAENLGVRLLIDAEYTYLNPALRILSLAMMLQYNRVRPIVAYTYQNYLKETYENLVKDCRLVRSKGAGFATKLVRGAYMHKERQMVIDGCYEDPVNPTFEDTTAMYNQSMEHLFDAIQREPDKFYVVVASHNEETVKHAVQEIKSRNLKVDSGSIFFGQLYGMSDYLSSALGHSGFTVYKSIPYGPVDETIRYLHRRALENTAVMGGTQKERQLLWKTFVNRVTLGTLPKTHV